MCGKHRTGNRGLVALMLVAVGLLAGCSGNNADPAGRLDPATQTGLVTPPATQSADETYTPPALDGAVPAGLPQDEYVDPEVILARRGSVTCETQLPGDDAFLISADTTLFPLRGLATLSPAAGNPAWVVYRFADTIHSDTELLATVSLEDPATGPVFLGISNYGADRWDWTEHQPPSAQLTLAVANETRAYNAGGYVYLAVVSTGFQEVNVLSTALERNVVAPAPVGLTAGYDESTEQVTLAWTDPAETYTGFTYDAILIERRAAGGDWAELAQLPEGTAEYADAVGPENDLERGVEYTYRLRTRVGGNTGLPSSEAVGRLLFLDVEGFSASSIYPHRIVLSWQRITESNGYLIEIHHGGEWQALTNLDSGNYYQFTHEWNAVSGLELEFDTDYEYRIRAVFADNFSPHPATTTGSRSLRTAEGLAASDGDFPHMVQVTWNPIPHADGYQVSHRLGDGNYLALATLAGYTNTTFEHTHLLPAGHECGYGVEYDYCVRGTYQGEVMPWDTQAMDSGFRLVKPPSGLSASDGSSPDGIDLSWTTHPDVDGYKVYRDGTAPGDLVASLGNTGTWTDAIGDFDEHTYRVAATWQGIDSELSTPVTGFRNMFVIHATPAPDCYYFDIEEIDGRPAMAFRPYGLWNEVHFAQAQVVEPQQSSDWVVHTALVADAPSVYYPHLAVLDGRAAIACAPGNTYSRDIMYSRATVTDPATEADWEHHTVFSNAHGYTFLDFQEINGLPALSFYDGTSFYAQALQASPGEFADWAFSVLTDTYYNPRLLAYQGRPAMASAYNSTSSDAPIRMGLSLSATPGPPGDWVFGNVAQGMPRISPVVTNNRLALAFKTAAGELKYARALADQPAEETDWDVYSLHTCHEFTGTHAEYMQVIDGRPALCFLDDNGGDPWLTFAWAKSADPASAADWDLYRVANHSATRMTIVEINGKPVLGYQGEETYYAYAQD